MRRYPLRIVRIDSGQDFIVGKASVETPRGILMQTALQEVLVARAFEDSAEQCPAALRDDVFGAAHDRRDIGHRQRLDAARIEIDADALVSPAAHGSSCSSRNGGWC